MPERDKARRNLVIGVVGHQAFNGLIGECVSMPNDRYWELSDAADVLIERIVDGIDWNRVYLEATNRHHELVANGSHRETAWDKFAGNARSECCPDCLRESLLADDTFPRHDPQPAGRRDTGQDVFPIFADALKYRRA